MQTRLLSAVLCFALIVLLLPQPGQAQDKQPVAVIANIGVAEANQAIFSGDGRLLVTLNSGANARLWDTATGLLLRRLEDKTYIGALVFSPDGRWIVSGHKDGKITLWDVTTGAVAATLAEGQGSDDFGITSLWIDPAGELLVAGNFSGTISVFSLAARKQTDRFEFGEPSDAWRRIVAVRMTADRGKLIGLTPTSVRVLDIKKRERVFSFDLSAQRFSETSIAGEHGLFAQSSSEGCVPVYFMTLDDPKTSIDVDKPADCGAGKSPKDSEHAFGEPAIYPGADGSRIIVTRFGMPELKLWNSQTRQIERSIRWAGDVNPKIIGISPDLALAATADENRLTVRKLETGASVGELKSFGYGAESVALSADGRSILVAHERAATPPGQKDIEIWRRGVAAPRSFRVAPDKDTLVRDFAPGPMLAAVSNDEKGELAIFSLQTGKVTNRFRVAGVQNLSRVRMSPDGKTLAVIGTDAQDKAIAVAAAADDGKVRTRFPGRDRPGRMVASDGRDDESNLVTANAFSFDGKQLALGRWNGTAEIWQQARRLSSLPAAREGADQIRSLAFSDDSQMLAGGSRNSGVFLWNLTTRRLVRMLDYDDYLAGHAHFASVAISHDRKLVAAGLAMHAVSSGDTGPEHGIKVWNVATGKLLFTLRGHQGGVGALGFSADDPWLVSASYDGTIRYWDRATGKPMATCATSAAGGWLIVTESGFFAGSPGAEMFVNVVRGLQSRPSSQFRDTLYRPDLVEALLGGDREGRYRAAARALDLGRAWADGMGTK